MINGYSQDDECQKAMSSVGAIIENPEFYSYLTGYENLELYASMHEGVSDERILEVVKEFGWSMRFIKRSKHIH